MFCARAVAQNVELVSETADCESGGLFVVIKQERSGICVVRRELITSSTRQLLSARPRPKYGQSHHSPPPARSRQKTLRTTTGLSNVLKQHPSASLHSSLTGYQPGHIGNCIFHYFCPSPVTPNVLYLNLVLKMHFISVSTYLAAVDISGEMNCI